MKTLKQLFLTISLVAIASSAITMKKDNNKKRPHDKSFQTKPQPTKRQKQGNSGTQTSLLDLPPELFAFIAKKMNFETLLHFLATNKQIRSGVMEYYYTARIPQVLHLIEHSTYFSKYNNKNTLKHCIATGIFTGYLDLLGLQITTPLLTAIIDALIITKTYTKIHTLNLVNNQLTSLPNSIGNLTQLQKLRLTFNHLTSLPDSIGNLTQLKTLSLGRNRLTSLPNSIGNLTQLQELYLRRNILTSLPNSIGNLTQLQELDLSFNFRFTFLPNGNLLWHNRFTPQIQDTIRNALPNAEIIF